MFQENKLRTCRAIDFRAVPEVIQRIGVLLILAKALCVYSFAANGGIKRIFLDVLSEKLTNVVEIEGGLIYPKQEKVKALRGVECKIDGVKPRDYLLGRETVKIGLYADPVPIIIGQEEKLPIRKRKSFGLTLG